MVDYCKLIHFTKRYTATWKTNLLLCNKLKILNFNLLFKLEINLTTVQKYTCYYTTVHQ